MVKITKEELQEYIDITKKEKDSVIKELDKCVSKNIKPDQDLLMRRYIASNLLRKLMILSRSKDPFVFIDYRDYSDLGNYKQKELNTKPKKGK